MPKKARSSITNNQLVGLALIAAAISVLGTFMTFGPATLTGYLTASDTGTVDLSISGTAGCTLLDSDISFGARSPLDTVQSVTLSAGNKWLWLNNTGNDNVTVQAHINQSLFEGCSMGSSCFKANCSTVDGGGTCVGTLTALAGSGSKISLVTGTGLQTQFYGNSYLNTSYEITVPAFEPSGGKISEVTLTCTTA